ncbi:MAG TPA: hypothetical protein VJT78_12765 [Candidatus Dormibacteraeota bacterium]|nr:hypothetical protein [Candidatus Dormibacteraeota bacterium]
MDPVTLIVAALGAGVTVVANAAIGEAVKDAYAGLKSRLVEHFRHKPEHEAALTGFESDPEAAAPSLAAAVSQSGAQQDPAVLEAARSLLAQVDPDGSVARKYSLLIKGNVNGLVQGDHNTVTMNFGRPEGDS